MFDELQFPTAESKLITFQIGAICVNWSSIDASLGTILGTYMKLDSQHRDVATSIIDLSRKCDLIKALSFIYDTKHDHSRLSKVLNFLDADLRPIRNRYVHDGYSFFTGDHIRKIFKTKIVNVQSFKKELQTRQLEAVTSKELMEFNKDLDACAMFLTFHSLFAMVNHRKVEQRAIESLLHVGEESYIEIEKIIKRYRSKRKNGDA